MVVKLWLTLVDHESVWGNGMGDVVRWPIIGRDIPAEARLRQVLPVGPGEDARLEQFLIEQAELVRRKLVAIKGPEFALRVLREQVASIAGTRDCQGETT